jgi:hypothetical protein
MNTYRSVAYFFKVRGEVIHLGAVVVFDEDRAAAIEMSFITVVSSFTQNESFRFIIYAPLNLKKMLIATCCHDRRFYGSVDSPRVYSLINDYYNLKN